MSGSSASSASSHAHRIEKYTERNAHWVEKDIEKNYIRGNKKSSKEPKPPVYWRIRRARWYLKMEFPATERWMLPSRALTEHEYQDPTKVQGRRFKVTYSTVKSLKCFTRNKKKSFLHRFPPEILLRIAEFLPGNGAHLLANTCVTFKQLLSGKLFEWISSAVDEACPPRLMWSHPVYDPCTSWLLGADDVCWHCRMGRPLSRYNSLKPVTCHSCYKPHPAMMFSHKQSNVYPRKCLGKEGKMRLCAHKLISFNELQAACNNKKKWRVEERQLTYVTCDHSDHDRPNWSGKVAANLSNRPKITKWAGPQLRRYQGSSNPPSSLVCQWQELVMKVPRNAYVDSGELTKNLAAIQQYICPHETHTLKRLAIHSGAWLNCVALDRTCDLHCHSSANESSNELDIPYQDCRRCGTKTRLFRWVRSQSDEGPADADDEIILLVKRVIINDLEVASPLWMHHLDYKTYKINRTLTRYYLWCNTVNCTTRERRFPFFDLPFFEKRWKTERTRLGTYWWTSLWMEQKHIAQCLLERRKLCIQGKAFPRGQIYDIERSRAHLERCYRWAGRFHRMGQWFEDVVDIVQPGKKYLTSYE